MNWAVRVSSAFGRVARNVPATEPRAFSVEPTSRRLRRRPAMGRPFPAAHRGAGTTARDNSTDGATNADDPILARATHPTER
jgi:hypothetical protein